MNRSVAIFGAVAIITGTSAIWLWQRLSEARPADAPEQVVQAAVAAKAPLQELEEVQISAQPQSGPSARNELSTVQPEQAIATAIATSATVARPRFHGRLDRYPELAQELGMTTEEAEDFAALLDEQMLLLGMRSPPNVPPLTPEQARANAEFERKQKSALETRLGSRYPKWQAYEPTLEARRGVREFGSMLPANAQLSEMQTQALRATLIAESRRVNDDNRNRIPATADPRSQLDYEEQRFRDKNASAHRILDAGRSYFTPEQIASLESILAESTRKTQASLRTRRENLALTGK